MIRVLTILLALSLAAAAAERKEFPRKHLPEGLDRMQSTGDFEATNQMHVSFGLALRNTDTINAVLADIENPASTNYRHWLTYQQFVEQFSPTTNDYAAVLRFAETNGLTVSGQYSNRLTLSVDAPASAIERVLKVKMKRYRHPMTGRTFHSPDREPSIPSPIPIDSVSGLDSLARPEPHWTLGPGGQTPTGGGSGASGSFRGWDFRHAYLPGLATNVLTGTGQVVGIYSLYNFSTTDLGTYRTATGLPAITLVYTNINGGTATLNPEMALDIDMVRCMAPGCTIKAYVGNPLVSNYSDILQAMAYDSQIKQFTMSYGTQSSYLGHEYFDDNANALFLQIRAQGQSFFCSSGDWDSYTTQGAFFPSNTTNVVCVGGTTLTMSGAGYTYVSETAWNFGNGSGTGGGISTIFNLPYWQQGVSMTSNLGSTAKKNMPDVAMVASQLSIYYQGAWINNAAGTSASTPLWAGLCALINQQADSFGQPSVGFLTPAIWSLGKSIAYTNCFHDIKTGNNFWSLSPTKYPAVSGYDLCTGWGTPKGTNLINALYRGPTVVSLSFSNGLFKRAY